MINADKFEKLKSVMDRISKIERVTGWFNATDPEERVYLGAEYMSDRMEIHKGQLQQDIIKALNAEIERLEHLAEQLKGEL